MFCSVSIVFLLILECSTIENLNDTSTSVKVDDKLIMPESKVEPENLSTLSPRLQGRNLTKIFEKQLKTLFRDAVKRLLPNLMDYNTNSNMSRKCVQSLTKFIGALTSVKVWAVTMLDSSSKLPAGIFEGTLSDFGAFDQCLGISVPLRNGSEDFRGSYCALEARPTLAPIPHNFSLAVQPRARPHDTIGEEIYATGGTFYFLQFRFGACVPSTCSVEDMRAIVSNVGKLIQMEIKVPQCYMKEGVKFRPIHIIVICILIFLLALAIAGSVIEAKSKRMGFSEKQRTTVENILVAFSLSSNYSRLISKSKGSEELKALHGIRALSIAWVVMGHSYVWTTFQLLRRPSLLQEWFSQPQMEPILNGWLSVEPFFFLSGLLTAYAGIQVMEKTKGRINILIFILRRYIRLTPSLLLVMGLIFFLPLISSGPFWYERMDPELRSCENYWWTNLLYISNWTTMKNICVHPTWYLSADFQLHVFSLLILFPLYRSSVFGFSVMALATVASNIAIGVLTYLWKLPPAILISAANDQQIADTVDIVHMRTFTHMGPFCIGMATGYLILKHRGIRLSKLVLITGWCCSSFASLAAVYGIFQWMSGHPHGQVLTCLYAALHRSAFILGVAWVAFACVTGYGGPVNTFLSSSMLAPLSRLTFMVYLLHSLVIWTKKASQRERMAYSNYNVLYEYIANVVISVVLAVPCYLLVEAPVSNLDRLIFSRVRIQKNPVKDAEEFPTRILSNSVPSTRTSSIVELTSVKTVLSECDENNSSGNCTDKMNGHRLK